MNSLDDDLRNEAGRTIVRILMSGIIPNYDDPEDKPQFFGAAGTGVWFKPPPGIVTNLVDGDMAFVSNAHVIDSAAVIFINHPEWGSLRLQADAVGALRIGDKSLIVVRDIPGQIEDIRVRKQSKFADALQTWYDNVQATGPIPFATRDMLSMMVDRPCAVIGFPLNQANQVITRGVISSIQLFPVRSDKTLLLFQTDAAMNHGNSGGGMVVEIDGQVYYVGIPSLGIPDASNVGYVLPFHHVASTLAALMTEPRSKLSPTRISPKEFLNVEGPYRGFTSTFLQGDVDGYVIDSIDQDETPFDVEFGDILVQVGDGVVGDDGLFKLPWTDVRVPYDTAFDELDLAKDTAQIIVLRNGQRIVLEGRWRYDVNLPIRQHFGALEPIKYESFAGLVVSELNLDQVAAIPRLAPFAQRPNRLQPRLAVVQVDPIAQSPVQVGWIVTEVNGVPVQTYEQWYKQFVSSTQTDKLSITFNTLQGSSPTIAIDDLNEAILQTVRLSKVRNERVTEGVEEARFIEREQAASKAGPSSGP